MHCVRCGDLLQRRAARACLEVYQLCGWDIRCHRGGECVCGQDELPDWVGHESPW